MPKRDDIQSILLIGSGPIVIGQACEFDYSGTQACRVLREEGYRVILANSNPATIMTDPEFADATYVEPLDVDVLTAHHRAGAARRGAADPRRADRAQPGHGARRERACSTTHGVELIGANAEAIATAEDREQFKEAMQEIGLSVPVVGHRAHDGRGPRGRRRDRPARSSSGPPTSSAARAPASPPTPRSSSAWPDRARRQPDQRDPHRAVDRRAGRSSSSRSCATAPTTA